MTGRPLADGRPKNTLNGGNKMSTAVKFSGLDYSNEATSVSFYLEDLTSVNFDAQQAKMLSIQTAIKGVSLIAFNGTTYPSGVNPREQVPPPSPQAQREAKWRLRVVDNVNGRVSNPEIGGADLIFLLPNSQFLDLTAGPGLALKNTIESDAVSRDGNPVTLVSAQHVGRAV